MVVCSVNSAFLPVSACFCHVPMPCVSSFMAQGCFGSHLVSLRTRGMLEDACHVLHATAMALVHLSSFILCCSNGVQCDNALLCHVKSPAWTASSQPELMLALPNASSLSFSDCSPLSMSSSEIWHKTGSSLQRKPCTVQAVQPLCRGYRWLS